MTTTSGAGQAIHANVPRDRADESPLLEFDHLSVVYRGARRMRVSAVDDVSFSLLPGETVGLVGESGSGKTTIGSAAVGLAPVTAGKIRFEGQDVTHATGPKRRALSRKLQIIFQDPYSSLNPLRTIGQTLIEPLLVNGGTTRQQQTSAVSDMLSRVGLDPTAAGRYPANFSGGERQRVAIARALMASPKVVVCDEAVSALDLSVQAQVLNLLAELQRELDISYLFISHDLSVVRHMCDRVAVLYRGQIVELGEAGLIHDKALHPYTQALLTASPLPDPGAQRRLREKNRSALNPARPTASLKACRFANRCPLATDVCEQEAPELKAAPDGRLIACHHIAEAALLYSSRVEHTRDGPVNE